METYETKKEFETELQSLDCCPDLVKIGDVVYTMDNYDELGKELSFGNKRTFKGFIIKTNNNRYKNGFKDSKVTEIEETCIRNDICYFD